MEHELKLDLSYISDDLLKDMQEAIALAGKIEKELYDAHIENLDCGHDGEDTDLNCPTCKQAAIASAYKAGVPSVVNS